MNKINYIAKQFILPLIIALFALSACKQEAEVREPSVLEIQNANIKIKQEGGEMIVNVTTNEPQFIAVSNKDWLTASPQEGAIKLVYEANNQVASRKALVLVQAGEATQQIMVEQVGSTLSVMTSPEEIVLDPWAHEATISVRLNSNNWSVTSNQEWLSVTALPWKNEIVLKVTGNKSEDGKEGEERKAELLFLVDGSQESSTVVVTQKEWPLFMLPFIDFEFGTKSIVNAFEMDRKSMLQSTNAKFLDFTTISFFISRLSYTFSTRGTLDYAQMDISEPYKEYDADGNEVMTKQAIDIIDKGLTANGFTEKRSDNEYYHPEKRVLAEVKKNYGFNPHVLYSYIPKQKEKYPTFTEIPYPKVPFGSDYETIKAWESKNGGEYDDSSSDYNKDSKLCLIAYKVPQSKQIKYRNYYLTYDGEKPLVFIGYLQEWYDLNLVYYENNGHLYITEEFAALMEKEGFKYTGKDKNDFDSYENSEKQLSLKVKFAHFEGEDDPSLVIFMLPNQSGKSGKLSIPNSLMKKQIVRSNNIRSAK